MRFALSLLKNSAPYTVLLGLIFSGSLAVASEECKGLVSPPPPPAAVLELARQAAELFVKAETEVSIDYKMRGVHKGAIDLGLAKNLRSLIAQLEQAPGDHLAHIEVFKELADVLDGTVSVLDYSRKSFISIPKDPSPSPQANPMKAWQKIEALKGLYQKVGENLYVKDMDLFNTPFKPFSAENLSIFMSHSIGHGINRLIPDRSNEKLNYFDFTLMARLPKSIETYEIKGSTLTIKATGETRTIVEFIGPASPTSEAFYYKTMADDLKIKEIKVPMLKRIYGHGVISIPGRVVFKVEHKHRIPIERLVDYLKTTDLSTTERLTPLNSVYFTALGQIEGKTIKLVLLNNSVQSDGMILKTTYFEDIENEDILKDLDFAY